jgi:hypothetical protein
MFIECCGDRPVNDYQRADLAGFYDILRALPKLYAKSREGRGLPLSEIVAPQAGFRTNRISRTSSKAAVVVRLGAQVCSSEIGDEPAGDCWESQEHQRLHQSQSRLRNKPT